MQQGMPASLNSCLFRLQILLVGASHLDRCCNKPVSSWHRSPLARIRLTQSSNSPDTALLCCQSIFFPDGLHADLVIASAEQFPFSKDYCIEAANFRP